MSPTAAASILRGENIFRFPDTETEERAVIVKADT
jgi:hypothetical protein